MFAFGEIGTPRNDYCFKSKIMKTIFKKFIFLTVMLVGLSLASVVWAANPINFNPEVDLPEFQGDMTITNSSLGTYIQAIYKYGLALGASLAVIVIMIGGVIWLTSAGSPEKVKNAKNYIGGAITGLVLLLGSYLLLYTINPKLVEFGPLEGITEIKGKKPGCNWYDKKPGNNYELGNPGDCGEEQEGKICYCYYYVKCEWQEIDSSKIKDNIYYQKSADSQCTEQKPSLNYECRCPVTESDFTSDCCHKKNGWTKFSDLVSGKVSSTDCIDGCTEDRCKEFDPGGGSPIYYICCLPDGEKCDIHEGLCCSSNCSRTVWEALNGIGTTCKSK